MSAVYSYCHAICCAQLPVTLLMLWLGYTCSVGVITVEALSEPVVVGGVSYSLPVTCPHVPQSFWPRSRSHNASSEVLTFVTRQEVLGLGWVYLAAACAACALGCLYRAAPADSDEAADGDKALEDPASVITEGVFWLFCATHAVAAEGLATGALTTRDTLFLRVVARVGGLMLACCLPRGNRHNMVTMCALLCLFGEAWLSLDAACTQPRSAVTLVQRALDVALVVGHKAPVLADEVCQVHWRARAVFTACACVVLQAGVLAAR